MAGSDPQPRGRAAVVVLHGIGAQPPLATLSSLAQGLIDRARGRGERLRPRPALVRIAGMPRPVVRFEDGADLGGFATVDLYEFAWQGLVQGRATPRAVLRWLLRTGLAPLHVRRHWRVLSEAGANAPAAWAIVAWQSLFTALLLLVVLALVLGLAGALLQLPRAWPVVSRVLPAAAAALGPLGALVLAAGAVPGAVALASVAGVVGDALEAASLRRASARLAAAGAATSSGTPAHAAWAGTHAGVARSWAGPALAVAAGYAALAALAVGLGRDAWSVLFEAVRALPAVPGLLSGVVAAVALVAVARLLERVVGDIALYVTSDVSSPFHRTRQEVEASVRDLLVGLLRLGEGGEAAARGRDGPPYDAVVLVGHSLGSVIALDALNQLSREARAGDGGPGDGGPLIGDPVTVGPGSRGRGDELPLPVLKLRGLLTFGSPLDKVAYFFGERVGDGSAVHAQLSSFLHPTRRRPSRRDDGPYAFAPYHVPFGWLRWVHLHAPLDPVSDPLVYYRIDDRRVRPYPWPGTAHGRYWRDPVTFDALVDLLAAARR